MNFLRSGSTLILILLAFLCLSGTVVLGRSFTVRKKRKCNIKRGRTSKVWKIVHCKNKCLADISCKGYETFWMVRKLKYKCKLFFTTPTKGKKSIKSTCAARLLVTPEPSSNRTRDPTFLPSSFPTSTPSTSPSISPVVPPTTSPTSDANEWLVAHNKRREIFHAKYGVSFVPLMWSSDLETSAQAYAEKLAIIPGCVTVGGYEGDSYGGENRAANWGSDAPRTPDQVLKYWADDGEPLG